MKRERVLVVGVRSEHAKKLKEMYKNLDLDFLTDQSIHKPVSNINAYGHIFAMTKFTSHSMHKCFRKHPGYIMVSGAFTNLKHQLQLI